MATTPTNSTTVSILNLPQAQLATATDYIVMQTTNGTQIIPFRNFNVVKTDINGNATVVGGLSGNNATFVGGINTVTLTASQYYTNGGQQGYNPPVPGVNYYDSLTIANGLVISAVPTSVNYANNPLYLSLFTQLTAVSAKVTKSIFDSVVAGGITIAANASPTYSTGNITGIPAGVTSLAVTDFIITPGNGSTISTSLTCVPYIASVGSITSGTAIVTLNAGGSMPISITYGVRCLKTY